MCKNRTKNQELENFANLVFKNADEKISKNQIEGLLNEKSKELGLLAYLAKSKRATPERKKIFEIKAENVLNYLPD